MSDLLFRAGIDDTPFRSGLKRLVKSGEDAARSLERKGGVGGLIKEMGAGFKAGLGFFGAQQAIRGIGQMWSYARQELEAYDKVNRSAGYRGELGNRSKELTNRGVGRLIESSGARDVYNEFAKLPGVIANSLMSESERKKYRAEEVATHRRAMSSELRGFSGPLDEEVMRLQGKNTAAGLHQVRRELADRREQIRLLRELAPDKGGIDDVTATQLTASALRNARFGIGEVLRSQTRGVASDVPVGLRLAVGGRSDSQQQDKEITQNENLSGQGDKFYEAALEMNESVISLTNELKQFGERIVNGTAPHHTYTNSN